MGLYTRLGDSGETGLSDGTRVWKDDLRVSTYGTVDELNAVLGWCRVAATGEFVERLVAIQRDLLDMGAHLAAPPNSERARTVPRIGAEQCRRLETWIDESTARVEPLSHFILPGGCELAARLQVARTVCRRAERAVVSLHRTEPLAPEIIVYLNRLSDLMFAWSRQANREAHCPDVIWTPGHRPSV